MTGLAPSQAYAYPILLLVLVIPILVGGIGILKRKDLTSVLMGLAILALGFISGGYALQILSIRPEAVLFWNRSQSLGYGVLTAVWVPFIFLYIGKSHWVNRKMMAGAAVVPVISTGLALTNRFHGLVLRETFLSGFLIQELTPLGAIFSAYNLAVLCFAGVFFAQTWLHSQSLFRKQGISLLSGSIIVLVLVILEISGNNPLQPVSLIPLGAAVSGFFAVLAVQIFEIGRLLPAAREKLFDEIKDGLVVIDPQGQIVDLNPAARAIFRVAGPIQPGLSFASLLEKTSLGQVRHPDSLGSGGDILLNVDGSSFTYEWISSPLIGATGLVHGQMILLRNVTGRERLEADLLQRSTELARSNALLSALGRIATRIENLNDPVQVYEVMAEELRALALYFALAVFKDETDQVLVLQYTSVDFPLLHTVEKLVGRSFTGIEIEVDRIPKEGYIHSQNTWYARNGLDLMLAMFPELGRPIIRAIIEKTGLGDSSGMVTLTLPAPGRIWGYGTLSIWGSTLSKNDVPALVLFGDQLAAKLEKIQLLRKERRYSAELGRSNAFLTALSQITARIQGLTAKEEVYRVMAEELRGLSINFILSFFNPERDEFLVIDFASVGPELLRQFKRITRRELIGFEVDVHRVPKQHREFRNRTWFVDDASDAVLSLFPEFSRPIFQKLLDTAGILANTGLASISLPAEGRPGGQGVISLWGTALTEQDMPALVIFAGQLAGILEKNRLIAAERERTEQLDHSLKLLSALSTLALQLESTRDPRRIYETLGTELKAIGLTCFIGEVRQSDGKLSAPFTTVDRAHLDRIEKLAGKKFEDYVIDPEIWPGFNEGQRGTAIFVRDPIQVAQNLFSPRLPRPVAALMVSGLGITGDIHIASLPLKVGERLTGVLSVWGDVLREEDIPALNVFANQLAVTMASARHYEETNRLRAFNENIVQGVSEAVLVTANEGQIRFANPAAERLLAQTQAELVTENLNCFLERVQRNEGPHSIHEIQTETQRGVVTVLRKNGDKIPAILSRRPLPGETAAETLTWIVVITDLSERERAQEELRRAEEKYHLLVEQIPAVTYISSGPPENRLVYISPQVESLLGYRAEDWLNDPELLQRIVDPRDRPAFDEASRLSWETGAPFNLEYRFLHHAGHPVWVRDDAAVLLHAGKKIMQGVVTDITARRAAEELLEKSLREKELMLKEIHHRVKNNLQVVSSLINLEAQRIPDGATRAAFEDSQNRIRSMALIHERIYRSPDLSAVNFIDYTRELVLYLFQNYRIHTRKVEFDLQPQCDLILGIDQAIPCGLILNEMVSNALKHAFPAERGGKVAIRLACCGDEVQIEVEDDGIGFPPDLDFRHPPSLGFQLINGLVSQLDGKIDKLPSAGTGFRIRFPQRNA